jgi:hypothetical protein
MLPSLSVLSAVLLLSVLPALSVLPSLFSVFPALSSLCLENREWGGQRVGRTESWRAGRTERVHARGERESREDREQGGQRE